MEINFKKILLIAAHPDDIEFGMGATLSKIRRDTRSKIKAVVFADCEEQPGNKGITKEFKKSMAFFGLSDYKLYDFPNTRLSEHAGKIRQALEGIKTSFQPDLIFSMSRNSIHQDHECVAVEVERVFRNISFLAFEDVKSSPYFKPTFFNVVTKEDLKKKVDALLLYKTQYRRYYHDLELMNSIARFRGALVGAKYAEAFEVVRFKS
ncbi:MAG TPA: PIG-L family deacetylase [Candidatus Nitrosotalea sp.]|nr:PIG-L family deacetylase [Candidatus Nitrosotalea sp.]